MRKFPWTALLVFLAAPAIAADPILKISRVSSTDQRLNVVIENAPLSSVVRALELHLSKPVKVERGADRLISYRAKAILPAGLLDNIVRQEGLVLESRGNWMAIRDPNEPTVTLDVKDAEIGFILREMKQQCGIRNVMMDPEIKDLRGTFLFTEVPCTVALQVVFTSLGLTAGLEPNSVLSIETPR